MMQNTHFPVIYSLFLSRKIHVIKVVILKIFSSSGINWLHILFQEFDEIPSESSGEILFSLDILYLYIKHGL